MENQTTSNPPADQNLSSHPIKWGVITGLIGVIITILVYIISPEAMVHWSVGVISFVIVLGLLLYSGFDYRKKLGGFMTFKQAFLHSFVFLVIYSAISVAFGLLLYNVIDPDLPKILIDAQMENQMAVMETFGGSGNTEMMDQMEQGFKDAYEPSTQLLGFVYLVVFSAIGSLIIGAITKKKPKEDF